MPRKRKTLTIRRRTLAPSAELQAIVDRMLYFAFMQKTASAALLRKWAGEISACALAVKADEDS
jgi:hypothetical protein